MKMGLFVLGSVVLCFCQPHLLTPEMIAQIHGERVVVLDLSFNRGTVGNNIREMRLQESNLRDKHFMAHQLTTGTFITQLTALNKLEKWVDHHPHPAWSQYENDPRFLLLNRRLAPACAMMITPEIVTNCDWIITHGDYDGIISAAIWLNGGRPPYPEAVTDAIATDTRSGNISPIGQRYEQAIKANIKDDSVRFAVLSELVTGIPNALVTKAVVDYQVKNETVVQLAQDYALKGQTMVLDLNGTNRNDFDFSQLLLAGQNKSPSGTAIVICPMGGNKSCLVVAADQRKWNLPQLFNVGGADGRIRLPLDKFDEVVDVFNRLSNLGNRI